jgi:hypothetical protein
MLGGGWCKKLPAPFVIDPQKRYRVVLFERLQKPCLGKQIPPMTRGQRERPNSKGRQPSGMDQLTWSPSSIPDSPVSVPAPAK